MIKIYKYLGSPCKHKGFQIHQFSLYDNSLLHIFFLSYIFWLKHERIFYFMKGLSFQVKLLSTNQTQQPDLDTKPILQTQTQDRSSWKVQFQCDFFFHDFITSHNKHFYDLLFCLVKESYTRKYLSLLRILQIT